MHAVEGVRSWLEVLRKVKGARYWNEVSIIGHQVERNEVRICTELCANRAVANI